MITLFSLRLQMFKWLKRKKQMELTPQNEIKGDVVEAIWFHVGCQNPLPIKALYVLETVVWGYGEVIYKVVDVRDMDNLDAAYWLEPHAGERLVETIQQAEKIVSDYIDSRRVMLQGQVLQLDAMETFLTMKSPAVV